MSEILTCVLCKNIATYGCNNKLTHCHDHKGSNMKIYIDYDKVKIYNTKKKYSKECIYHSCSKQSSFNFIGNPKKLLCGTHKLNGMINVGVKSCLIESCNKQPCFNYENKKKPLYCLTHKKENMINVKKQKCESLNCNIEPIFNYSHENKPRFCTSHKLDYMIDIRHKNCIIEGCEKRSRYNYITETTTLYCNKHKLENMICIGSKICNFSGCNKMSSFNFENDAQSLYCADHKLNEMIDVRHLSCKFLKCNKIPCYNYEGKIGGKYCFEHKIESMIDVTHKKCTDCNIRACYNFKGEKLGIYCASHKLNDMINVIDKKCNMDGCEIRPSNINKKYKGYCVRCYIHLFPDERVSRNYKIKENYIKDYILSNLKDIKFVFDKKIGGRSLRPDIYIDLLTHIIIIEIDEDQHKRYGTTCEISRMNQLYEDFNFRPIIFIRFNPDAYIDKHNVRIKSCFTLCKTTGIQIIATKKKTEWKLRLESLKNTINAHINTVPDDNKIVYLYYDKK